MSDYKTIHGISIRDYTTDPDNLITGQVWFDKTNKVLQFQAEGAGAWASGGNLNTGRAQVAGAGTQTAGLAFGGGYPAVNNTEKYNGSSWTEVNNLNAGRRTMIGFGTQTAAIGAGGVTVATNVIWKRCGNYHSRVSLRWIYKHKCCN